MDEAVTKKENVAQVRTFVEDIRNVPYLSKEELEYILNKYEAFLKKSFGDNCHQIRFLRRISFFSTAERTKKRNEITIWYGGLNELIVLSNTLLELWEDEPPEEPIEYELPEELEEEEEEEIPDEEFFPTDEAAEIARKIKEIEKEEALQEKGAGLKEKETIPETPADLKELEKKVDVIADVLTFIFNGCVWLLKGTWKVLSRLIIHPEKLFKEWQEKIAASMEYKPLEEAEQQEKGPTE